MKLRIVRESEKEVTLALQVDGDAVDLVSLNPDGSVDLYLLAIRPDGTIHRYGSIPDDEGFNVDESGYIIVEDE